MCLVWVVGAHREEVRQLGQQISSSWLAVMRRQTMTDKVAQMLSPNLTRRPPRSARCYSLSIAMSLLPHTMSKIELVAFHAVPVVICCCASVLVSKSNCIAWPYCIAWLKCLYKRQLQLSARLRSGSKEWTLDETHGIMSFVNVCFVNAAGGS